MSGWRTLLLAVLLGVPVETVHAESPGSSAAGPRAFERDSLQAIRDAHAGQPFVMAMWSAYCEPCREELAMLVRFRAAHPQVAVVLVATDPPEELAAVRSMLAQYASEDVETWAFADAFVERLRYAVDPRWRGELPRTYLYDAQHRFSAISGRVDAARLRDWFDGAAASR